MHYEGRYVNARKGEELKNTSKIKLLYFIRPWALLLSFVVLSLLLRQSVPTEVQRIEAVLSEHHFSLVGLERERFAQLLIQTSQKLKLDPLLVLAVMKVESGFRTQVVSNRGAIGLLQIKPVAAEEVSRQYAVSFNSKKDLFDPHKNVVIGIHYLAHLNSLFGQDTNKMLTAYNMGPTAVKKIRTLPLKYAHKVLRAYNGF